MRSSIPEASVKAGAFACPHCGAYAKQSWFAASGDQLRSSAPTPFIPQSNSYKEALAQPGLTSDQVANLKSMSDWTEQMMQGEPFADRDSHNVSTHFYNTFFSQCFNCTRVAIWAHDRLVYPTDARTGAPPHPDLPDHLHADYEEARAISDRSPRGAAALLRLLVQKLCVELGGAGKNIDDDIAALVSKGLDTMVQQGLDSLRVIGNESVHPGQMDLRDDRDTANQLFDLVNDIVAQTISRQKRAAAIYAKLPEAKRAAIDVRNEKVKQAGAGAIGKPVSK